MSWLLLSAVESDLSMTCTLNLSCAITEIACCRNQVNTLDLLLPTILDSAVLCEHLVVFVVVFSTTRSYNNFSKFLYLNELNAYSAILRRKSLFLFLHSIICRRSE